ncbi:DUF6527 family protein [Sphingomicrobium astaxanthinifaciens]|uniref:DUF6527 family protein n=1 Tax=Sphingomicrobium astaxanthinifaciens TaxID=1227949 RepID=UPI001FCAFD1A|nr:DUF6527 family protein [Sphingomicrobium astaxanthinifaciens]MCJ7420447.1 hypothetical protein [Sphingomicrobium astaxanthinifaciens]
MNFEVERVHFMPKQLEPGVLYVSDEFETAAHLCACGCGSKIRTPILPTEWRLAGSDKNPTLRPSVGNWQRPCRSHYFITNGRVKWCAQWTEEEIMAGRRAEQLRRERYYDDLNAPWWKRFWKWIARKIRKA